MSTAISGARGRGCLGGDLRDRGGELVVVRRAAAEQQAESGVVVGHPPEVGPEPELGLALAVGGLGRRLGDRIEQAVADLVEQRLVQVALRVEVLVQHRLGDTRGLGHVVHRRAVEAGRREDLERDIEDLFASGGGRKSLGHCYWMVTGITSFGQRPFSRSSRSAALTAYPTMIDGASSTQPMMNAMMTSVAIVELKPSTNAMTNSAIASATKR